MTDPEPITDPELWERWRNHYLGMAKAQRASVDKLDRFIALSEQACREARDREARTQRPVNRRPAA